jgi:hypothetical protein
MIEECRDDLAKHGAWLEETAKATEDAEKKLIEQARTFSET